EALAAEDRALYLFLRRSSPRWKDRLERRAQLPGAQLPARRDEEGRPRAHLSLERGPDRGGGRGGDRARGPSRAGREGLVPGRGESAGEAAPAGDAGGD